MENKSFKSKYQSVAFNNFLCTLKNLKCKKKGGLWEVKCGLLSEESININPDIITSSDEAFILFEFEKHIKLFSECDLTIDKDTVECLVTKTNTHIQYQPSLSITTTLQLEQKAPFWIVVLDPLFNKKEIECRIKYEGDINKSIGMTIRGSTYVLNDTKLNRRFLVKGEKYKLKSIDDSTKKSIFVKIKEGIKKELPDQHWNMIIDRKGSFTMNLSGSHQNT